MDMLDPYLSDSEPSNPDSDGTTVAELSKPKLRRPKQYRVFLLNDDYTPMEFVVEILESFFSMDRTKATQIMLTIHTQGKGLCGIYPKDIAETKALSVNKYSRESQHPLLCETEPFDDSED